MILIVTIVVYCFENYVMDLSDCVVVLSDCVVVLSDCVVVLSDCVVVLSDCVVVLSDCVVVLSDCVVVLSDCVVVFSDWIIVLNDCLKYLKRYRWVNAINIKRKICVAQLPRLSNCVMQWRHFSLYNLVVRKWLLKLADVWATLNS